MTEGRFKISLKPSLCGKLFDFFSVEFFNSFFKFFAGAEFDYCAFGDNNFIFGFVGVAALAALADFDFKNTEIAEFDGIACL